MLIDYLTVKPSAKTASLIDLMQKGICFTSVLNASELFMLAKTDFQRQKVRDILNALKVLGLHSRYSLSISGLTNRFNNIRDALFYILAEQNRLTIVSLAPEKYSELNVNSVYLHTIV